MERERLDIVGGLGVFSDADFVQEPFLFCKSESWVSALCSSDLDD
jgi:hypothetical protein